MADARYTEVDVIFRTESGVETRYRFPVVEWITTNTEYSYLPSLRMDEPRQRGLDYIDFTLRIRACATSEVPNAVTR